VSTARKAGDINSAGSQFFIMHAVSPNLDGQYTVFGEVIEGMEIVDMIAAAPKDMNNRPNENIYVKRVRVIKP
ncbi:peptidylprolyl isomerase, partial [candidate division KSB1 bacterium]|nr:peptidylprolyl isomerase [candidate division KSB1 bacterium]